MAELKSEPKNELKGELKGELTKDQKEAYELLKSRKNCFITGEAGTGKSFLINKFINEYNEYNLENLAITATTGISAKTIGGQTIHSWAGVGFGKSELHELISELRKPKNKNARDRWINTKILILDEISMISADLLDKLNSIGRILRHNDKPFGGIIVKAFGDFGQLEAVDADKLGLAFEAKCWNELFPVVFILKEIVRQKDTIFTAILSKIRKGEELSAEQIEILNECKKPRNPPIPGLKPLIINSRKDIIENLNTQELKKLAATTGESIVRFTAAKQIKGEIDDRVVENILNNEVSFAREILLTKGANVVLIKNLDVENGFCNGSRGVIKDFIYRNGKPVGVEVDFINGSLKIEPEKSEFKFDENKLIVYQLPLLLSWGLTAHRAQSLTLEYIKIGLDNCFSAGQFYSIISRCKTLDGIIIDNIDFNKIIVNKKVKDFYHF
jgi:ATP-dependent DNA helicase PIF1